MDKSLKTSSLTQLSAGKSSPTLHEFLGNTVYLGALSLGRCVGVWGVGARARGTLWVTPTWPHRSHHHRPLTASHEAKAIDRVPVNGPLVRSVSAWQLLTFHIICVLFLHHMAAGEGKMGAKKTQRQLSLRAAADADKGAGHGAWEFTHCFLHPLAPAEGMTDAYFTLRKNSL